MVSVSNRGPRLTSDLDSRGHDSAVTLSPKVINGFPAVHLTEDLTSPRPTMLDLFKPT